MTYHKVFVHVPVCRFALIFYLVSLHACFFLGLPQVPAFQCASQLQDALQKINSDPLGCIGFVQYLSCNSSDKL